MDHLEEIRNLWKQNIRSENLADIWMKIHPQTIDYGIMEKASEYLCHPCERYWVE